MSVISTINFEEGNLTDFTLGVTDTETDLSAQAAAALAGTNYGLQCVIDNTTGMWGASGNFNSTTGDARARFYFDPNSVALDNSEAIAICGFRNTAAGFIAIVWCMRTSGGDLVVYGQAQNDAAGDHNTANITITDAPHYIEFYVQRATAESSNDGRIDIWVDGANQQTVTGIDNYTRMTVFGYVRLGAMAFTGTPSGTIYLDELVVNDDGGEIGPVAAAGTAVPVFVHHLQMQGIG